MELTLPAGQSESREVPGLDGLGFKFPFWVKAMFETVTLEDQWSYL